jgi:nitroimidazol reductase NimA-like FMN-containing flavoprotein (pyridoxamine 5'-phosphate oxidase superfamily)/ribosomal protein S18 acetylase RimI-like enzyme
MPQVEALQMLARAPSVHLASTRDDGAPVLRTLHTVLHEGALYFHAAPVGEKREAIGRAAVVGVEEVVAAIPSYFVDPERACPATTLYRSVQAHGVVESVDDESLKAAMLQRLMEKLQPEGGHVPITAEHPLYRKAVAGLWIARIRLDAVDGKAKLAQNRTAEERIRLLELLWRRGEAGDPRAVELVRAANPDTPTPPFLQTPLAGVTLCAAVDERKLDEVCDLLDGTYWNHNHSRGALAAAHRNSDAWVGALDPGGVLIASARGISDGVKHAWIYDVVVAPPWRGGGLGQAVMRLILDHPRIRGAERVHLTTRDAMRLYRKLGFVEEAEVQRPWPNTDMLRVTR